jgi:hypothetical protein
MHPASQPFSVLLGISGENPSRPGLRQLIPHFEKEACGVMQDRPFSRPLSRRKPVQDLLATSPVFLDKSPPGML